MKITRLAGGLVAAGVLLCLSTFSQAQATPRPVQVQADSNAAAALAPGAVWKLIPYGAKRQAQMAEYSRIHYGIKSAALTDVRQIVLHYTAGSTVSSAWNLFAANAKARQPTGGYSYPGTCTHFIVGKDGAVYQLVQLGLMCRHAIGLNDQSVGIEFVEEYSASRVLARRNQTAAGHQLVRWLQQRYGIAGSDVIGHSMVNGSRYFTERQAGWRNTHTDWSPAQVSAFRAGL